MQDKYLKALQLIGKEAYSNTIAELHGQIKDDLFESILKEYLTEIGLYEDGVGEKNFEKVLEQSRQILLAGYPLPFKHVEEVYHVVDNQVFLNWNRDKLVAYRMYLEAYDKYKCEVEPSPKTIEDKLYLGFLLKYNLSLEFYENWKNYKFMPVRTDAKEWLISQQDFWLHNHECKLENFYHKVSLVTEQTLPFFNYWLDDSAIQKLCRFNKDGFEIDRLQLFLSRCKDWSCFDKLGLVQPQTFTKLLTLQNEFFFKLFSKDECIREQELDLFLSIEQSGFDLKQIVPKKKFFLWYDYLIKHFDSIVKFAKGDALSSEEREKAEYYFTRAGLIEQKSMELF